jgi:hypothetical protein
MPCYYTGSEAGDNALDAQEARKSLTEVTELLCMACKRLDNYNIKLPHSLAKWWLNHQQIDSQRKKRER